MKGYRDRYGAGEHVVILDAVVLRFGADGVLWNPTPAEEEVLTRDGLRRARFEPVENVAPPPTEESVQESFSGSRRRRRRSQAEETATAEVEDEQT